MTTSGPVGGTTATACASQPAAAAASAKTNPPKCWEMFDVMLQPHRFACRDKRDGMDGRHSVMEAVDSGTIILAPGTAVPYSAGNTNAHPAWGGRWQTAGVRGRLPVHRPLPRAIALLRDLADLDRDDVRGRLLLGLRAGLDPALTRLLVPEDLPL